MTYNRTRTARRGWTPPVDLFETTNEFVLTAELLGRRIPGERRMV